MALFLFTKAIIEGEPIPIYNFGMMERDFTYIDDIIEGVIRLGEAIPNGNPDWRNQAPDPATSTAPYRVFNIGNHSPISLLAFIDLLEKYIGRKANRNLLPMQQGDVPKTYADVSDLVSVSGFAPATPIEAGIKKFVEWYKNYYR
jgi:UDP-glucuronate 4-epimerase